MAICLSSAKDPGETCEGQGQCVKDSTCRLGVCTCNSPLYQVLLQLCVCVYMLTRARARARACVCVCVCVCVVCLGQRAACRFRAVILPVSVRVLIHRPVISLFYGPYNNDAVEDNRFPTLFLCTC